MFEIKILAYIIGVLIAWNIGNLYLSYSNHNLIKHLQLQILHQQDQIRTLNNELFNLENTISHLKIWKEQDNETINERDYQSTTND